VNFLAQLEHENIIKIRCVCSFAYQPVHVSNTNDDLSRGISDHESFHKNSFAVLDLLRETLDLRIKKRWKREVHKASGVFGCCCSNPDKLRDLWVDRLTVACDIANAIHFLHSRNILYRDLKPDNVGFDLDGVVKLFDFGLAKDVSNEHRIGGFYKLTGNTGSLRYMAPEVYLDLMYDESVDVYSFGILLWQLCDLTTPFVGFNRKLHATMVIGRQHRPKINPKWQPGLKALISNCWAHESSLRPDFKTVLSLLFEEANQLSKLFEKRYDSSFV